MHSKKDRQIILKLLLANSTKRDNQLTEIFEDITPELAEIIKSSQDTIEKLENENKKLKNQVDKSQLEIDQYRSEITYGKERLNDAINMLVRLATLDFDKKALISDQSDEYDGLAAGLNMLSQELKASTVSINYLEDIFKSMSEMLIVVDNSGVIQSSNPAARNVFGNQLIDNHIESVLLNSKEGSLKEFSGASIKSQIRKGLILNTQMVYKTMNGDSLPVEILLSPMQSKKGAVIIARDISERKSAEEKQKALIEDLEKSNTELRQFTHIASHDLKAPLRAISMLVEWVVEESMDVLNEDSKSKMTMIVDRVKRMYGFLDGMLAYSKIGASQVQRTELNLNEVVKDVINSLNIPNHITIKINHLPTIYSGELHLTQVFQNLISNAVMHMDKDEGTVEVGVSEVDGEKHFYVKDNGPGIEDIHFEKIFIIFQTLNARDSLESTGIGLTIVKKIIESYGGQVWLESELGQGTCFYFTLPQT